MEKPRLSVATGLLAVAGVLCTSHLSYAHDSREATPAQVISQEQYFASGAALDDFNRLAQQAREEAAQAGATPPVFVFTYVSIIQHLNASKETNGWLITVNETFKNAPTTLSNLKDLQMGCTIAGGPPATESVDGVLGSTLGINCSDNNPISVSSLAQAKYFLGIPCSQSIAFVGSYVAAAGTNPPKFNLLLNKAGTPFSFVSTTCTVNGKNLVTGSYLTGTVGQIYTVLSPYGYVQSLQVPAGNYTIFEGAYPNLPTLNFSASQIQSASTH